MREMRMRVPRRALFDVFLMIDCYYCLSLFVFLLFRQRNAIYLPFCLSKELPAHMFYCPPATHLFTYISLPDFIYGVARYYAICLYLFHMRLFHDAPAIDAMRLLGASIYGA